eukprot:TRINITY_DN12067_c0_g1_i2.p1 TRINITY_DN12067_c0_g1~~TRINITY_DN12067_c0_g1_i2.p1  ORF type:complete len:464 (+),score=119.10 TRINITY_DN12067_c0_g1_i2:68-1459(+)
MLDAIDAPPHAMHASSPMGGRSALQADPHGLTREGVEVGWWGLYTCTLDNGGMAPVKLLSAGEEVVEFVTEQSPDTGSPLVATYDRLRYVWDALPLRAAGTHVEMADADGDHIFIFPDFDTNTVSYAVNGTPRTGFTSLLLHQEEEGGGHTASLRFVKHHVERHVPLPLSYHPIVNPLRRLLDACCITHNLGKEEVCKASHADPLLRSSHAVLLFCGCHLTQGGAPTAHAPVRRKTHPPPPQPGVVGKWRKFAVPGGSGLQYWRSDTDRMASLRGPSAAEVQREVLQGSVGEQQTGPAYERLLDNLRSHGLRQVRVAGDGHCQFRSVAHLHFGCTAEFPRVRTEVVQHMQEHEDAYAPFCSEASFRDYLKGMGDSTAVPPCWGDHLTLQAAADLYNICFFLVTSRDKPQRVRPNDMFGHTAEPREVWMSYYESEAAMHYDAAEKSGASDSGSAGMSETGAVVD